MFDSQVPAGTEQKHGAKFTPGPWKADGSRQRNLIEICTVDDKYVTADVWSSLDRDGPCTKEDKADAFLIAAAPDMYAALQSAIEGCGCTLRQRESGHLVDCYAPAAIAALEKARGEKS